MITSGTSSSKLVAVLLLVAVVTVAYSLVDTFYVRTLKDNNLKIDRLKETFDAYEKRIVDLDALEKSASAIRQVNSKNDLYLQNNKESVVIAQLQSRLKGYIQSNRAVLNSSQVIASPEKERFKRLTMRLVFKTNPERLRTILYAIESQNPLLFVENISIKPREPAASATQHSDQELNIRMDVYGYTKIEGVMQ